MMMIHSQNNSTISRSDSPITFIDLFAGAGGLSEGFTSCGFFPVAHVEMNENACDTLRTRACYWYLKNNNRLDIYHKYLKHEISKEVFYQSVPSEIRDTVICEKMADDTMEGICGSIDASLKHFQVEKVDLIVGGPPCQAYSLVGRGRKDMSTDPRNTLYKQYLYVLDKYKPKMFVFENVPGLLTANKGKYFEDIQQSFRDRGYDINYRILDAADYGVLQHRKRIILVGWRVSSGYTYPVLTPGTYPTGTTVNDILSDLPALKPGEENNRYEIASYSQYLKQSGIRSEDDILTWHVTRPHREQDREIYKIAIEKWQNGGERLSYQKLPAFLKTHKNTTAFLDRFKVVEGDREACHTMVAHISKDGHYYIHPDMQQARSISVREAARIQSFPDNFYFEGARTSAFMQIGNAVPPLLAQAIASAVKKEFEEVQHNGKDD